MNKILTFIILIILSILEVSLIAIYFIAGSIDVFPIIVFVASIWNLGIIVGLFCHLIAGKRQAGGYMEVSNYLNLNKIANKDDK